ncbi:hypothetical protein MJL79_29415, partial [Salmonella enterica subsp. enterica serovar Montevideo]|nr:hypothetical protein [Salmonella enterica subsp. enterica serovar Montevideo]
QLKTVAEAEARLNAQPHGASLYLPMEGLNTYRHTIAPLLFGASKNESAAATVIAPDSTAPEMPKNVVISEDGTSISGTAEPGSA